MIGGAKATTSDSRRNASLGLMQNQNLLKERNGASSKPETQTPSSTLDTAVVVIDKMTGVKVDRSNEHRRLAQFFGTQGRRALKDWHKSTLR
jgi:hypothetical protein